MFLSCFKTSYVAAAKTCPCKTSYLPRMCAAALLHSVAVAAKPRTLYCFWYYRFCTVIINAFTSHSVSSLTTFIHAFAKLSIWKFILFFKSRNLILKCAVKCAVVCVYCGQSLSSVKHESVRLSFFVTERLIDHFDVFDWTLMQCQCHLFYWAFLLAFHRYSLAESYLRTSAILGTYLKVHLLYIKQDP